METAMMIIYSIECLIKKKKRRRRVLIETIGNFLNPLL